jgi:hypothetical protein
MAKPVTTHLYNAARGLTYCGKSRKQITVRGVKYWRVRELAIIGPNDLVDSATCKACQRVDDAVQVRDYRRECREANIDPDTMQPLPKGKTKP